MMMIPDQICGFLAGATICLPKNLGGCGVSFRSGEITNPACHGRVSGRSYEHPALKGTNNFSITAFRSYCAFHQLPGELFASTA